MMKALLLFLPLALLAQELPEEIPDLTPQQIEAQLEDAETEFKKAKEMFNPWYAGPLLTGSAHMLPPGDLLIQPYLFVTDTYGQFNSHHHSQDIPDLVQVNPQVILQAGITDLLDVTLTQSALFSWQNGNFGAGYGDVNVTFGLRVLEEGLWVPGMKIGVGETFPTGRYNNITNSVDVTGGGIYQTSLSYRIGKLVLWSTQHPLNLRATFTYTIPLRTSVKNLHAYGGGPGTRGKVRPGNQFNLSVGMEWSFTQKWVLANDFVFVHNRRTKFVGQTTASSSAPSNEQFSLAPAIEYNPSPYLNFLGGVWFTVIGRNSSNFIAGVISMVYTFQVK